MNSPVLANNFAKLPRNIQLTFVRALRTLRPLFAKDYYKALNLKKSCSDKEVRDAYIRLSKEFHPDKNPDGQKTGARFVEINEAYNVLGKTESRRRYDGLMAQADQPTRNYESRGTMNTSTTRDPFYTTYTYYYDFPKYRTRRHWNEMSSKTNLKQEIPLVRLVLSMLIAMFFVGILEFHIVKRAMKEPDFDIDGVPVFSTNHVEPDFSRMSEEQCAEYKSNKRRCIENAVRSMKAESDTRQREHERLRSMLANNAKRQKDADES